MPALSASQGSLPLGLGKHRITRKAGFREKSNAHRILELGSASDPTLAQAERQRALGR